jgi:flavin-dependent dehydrogenase
VVARNPGMTQLIPDHYAGGLRAYYEGVTGFHPGHYIELHFVEEAIPGYFWIFPMSNGRANVGVALLSSIIRKKRVRLQALLDDLVRHPRFSHRFSGARRVGPVRGWGLPLGSRPRALAGDGWMLTGDAGSLIDPFTGEGIGNAMVSGWYAGECAADAVAAGDFSRRMFSDYETRLMGRLKREFRLSHTMQQLARRRWLLDAVIGKASRSTELAETISCMFDDLSERQKLVSPLFYLRMLAA